MDFSKKKRATVITAVMIGNILEWYEIYLFVYWAPIISKLFFPPNDGTGALTNTFLVFALGFLSRPFGGIFFGRLGDRIGRKKALILSVLMMTVPTFVMGLLPTYHSIGGAAVWILLFMRLCQSFPAGGELPGGFCYLYESSPLNSRRFLCSWATVAYQLGILISTVECYLLEKFLSPESLISWGWRLSFFVGGLFGLFGLLLRYKLHETPLFQEMILHEKVVRDPILQVLYRYKGKILLGTLFCVLNSSAFYLLSVHLPIYFVQLFNTNYSNTLIYTIFFLLFITIPIPFFGYLGDKWNNKALLIGSTLAMIFLLYPLHYGIQTASPWITMSSILAYGIFFTCLSALIPYIVAELSPTYVRFTCTAISFNLADSVIGGFTPVGALLLINYTHNSSSFIWILLFSSLLSLIGYLLMKPRAANQY